MEKMQSQQRYISDELTHFLGRELKDEDDAEQKQYDVLCKIVKEGRLTPPPHEEHQLESGIKVHFNESAKPSLNQMVNPYMVCFCDIPLQDLNIHIQKYSPLGISFEKDFLARKGAMPVHYVPVNALEKSQEKTMGEYLDENVRSILSNHIKNRLIRLMRRWSCAGCRF